MAQMRIITESELHRGDVIGSGAFGTVYKVGLSVQKYIYRTLLLSLATAVGFSSVMCIGGQKNQT